MTATAALPVPVALPMPTATRTLTTVTATPAAAAHLPTAAVRAAAARPAGAVLAALALAVAPLAGLHLAGAGVIDPVHDTISGFVEVPGGYGLLAAGLGGLAVAALPLAGALAALPGTRAVRALLVSWAGAVALAAVFPTNLPGTPVDTAALVHRYAGAWLFAALPVAGLLLARRCAGRSARVLAAVALVAGAASAALILNYLPLLAGAPEQALPPGALQRAAALLQIGVLAAAALAVRQRSGSPGTRAVRAAAVRPVGVLRPLPGAAAA